jgi:hypothetical protein
MTSQLNLGAASSYQADMLREATLARRTANGSRHESLLRRAIARLHADAARSASARRTYDPAPTAR